MKKYTSLFLVFLAFSPLFATKDTAPIAFKAGDTVCFVGDSITHNGSYVKNVILFYATRYPNDKVDFYNLGISGDTIDYVNKRVNFDILSRNPKLITLMIGMNNAEIFLPKNPTEVRKKMVLESRAAYTKHLDEIIAKLQKADCKAILFTPSPYDEGLQKKDSPAKFGKNAELAFYSDVCKRAALKNALPVVDMWREMMSLNAELQKEFPELSFSGSDRVHPSDMGGVVMTANFVRTLGEYKEVSSISIDSKNSKVLESFNCDVSNLSASSDRMSFEVLEYALPFPLLKNTELSEKYTGFLKDYNNQFLRVSRLGKGKYALSIAGKLVGEYSSDELSDGVNLANNTKTPQYEQALNVDAACVKYREICEELRKIDATERWYELAEIPTLEARLESLKKQSNRYKHPYIRACAQNYENVKSKQADMLKLSREIIDEIYKTAAPVKRVFELKKVD